MLFTLHTIEQRKIDRSKKIRLKNKLVVKIHYILLKNQKFWY